MESTVFITLYRDREILSKMLDIFTTLVLLPLHFEYSSVSIHQIITDCFHITKYTHIYVHVCDDGQQTYYNTHEVYFIIECFTLQHKHSPVWRVLWAPLR